MCECFPFLVDCENLETATADVLDFVDSHFWSEFSSNPTKNENKSESILSILNKISTGSLSLETLMIENSPSYLVDLYLQEPNLDFFISCLNIARSGDPFAISFIETLLRRGADSFFAMKIQNQLDDILAYTFFQIALDIYSYFSNEIVRRLLLEFNHTLLLHFIFENYHVVKDTQNMIYELVLNINELENYIEIFKEIASNLLNTRNDSGIHSLLDFLEYADHKKKISYEELFTELFLNISNPSFVDLLVSRCSLHDKKYGTLQSELLPQSISSPLRAKFTAETLEIPDDNYVIEIAEGYNISHILPRVITEMFNRKRDYFDSDFSERIRRLAQSNQAVASLASDLVARGMMKEQYQTAYIKMIKENPNLAANEIGKYVEKSILTDQENAPNRMNELDNIVFKQVSQIDKQNLLTEVLKIFLQVPFPSESILESSAAIGLRIGITTHTNDIIDKDPILDCARLAALHSAAISTSTLIVPDSVSPPDGAVQFDPIIALRLRWRVLRGDAQLSYHSMQAFSSLAEDDIRLFLKWESKSLPPMSIESLRRLNLTSSRERQIEAFNTLLEIPNIKKNVIDNINTILLTNQIDESSIKMPERPNTALLFNTRFCWSRESMLCPIVCDALRMNFPPLIIIDGLIRFGEKESYERYFAAYPHALAAFILYYDRVNSLSIAAVDLGNNLVQNTEQPINGLKKNIAYAVASVITRRTPQQLLAFTNARPEPEIAQACLVFAVAARHLDQAVLIVKQRSDLIESTLMKPIRYEVIFFGRGEWERRRREFALFCANRAESVFSPEWPNFLQRVMEEPNTTAKERQDLDMYRLRLGTLQMQRPVGNRVPIFP